MEKTILNEMIDYIYAQTLCQIIDYVYILKYLPLSGLVLNSTIASSDLTDCVYTMLMYEIDFGVFNNIARKNIDR